MLSLSQAVECVGGCFQGADAAFDTVGIDGRNHCGGQLFVALRGERFDGHDFVAQAMANGAAAAMVERPIDLDFPQWLVEDTRLALGRLATVWRDRFSGRVVAVTGSNGKTTCKEMIAAVLGQVGTVRATQGNLNNDIGMPLTLLGARDEDFLVLEMGANHPGEIAYLTDIGRPDVAVITNAGRAHLEGFGSVEGVARSKGEIARGVPPDGIFIVPSDSPWKSLWQGLASGRRMLTCGPDPEADVRVTIEQVSSSWDNGGFRTQFNVSFGDQDIDLELSLAGIHNVRNALVAVAVASALEIPTDALRAGLATLKPVPRRLQFRICGSGLKVIDDSYNANPDSVRAAIEVLLGLPGRHWLVLGDLGELGPEARSIHRELGAVASAAGVEGLYAVGKLSVEVVAGFGEGARHFADQETLIAALRAERGKGDVVLVKGSRLAAMDRVADALCGLEGA